MKKVAITGNIAAGKSLVQGRLEALGYVVFDTDQAGHEALADDAIKAAFRAYDVFLSDGEISRQKLGRLVFSDSRLLRKLEKLSHLIVFEKMQRFFQQNRHAELVFVAVPLLFEVGLAENFDEVIFIDADTEIRKTRLIQRDNLTAAEAEARLNAQNSPESKIPQSDFVITNNAEKAKAYRQLDAIISQLLKP
jgi:dephospho-CoA kinase